MVPTYKTKLNREELCVAAMNEKDTMTRPFKTNILFNTGDWDTKVGTQVIPGVTDKFDLGIQNEAGQRLTEFCQENALVIANIRFQQHRRRLYTWPSPHGQY